VKIQDLKIMLNFGPKNEFQNGGGGGGTKKKFLGDNFV
jgi:hypothetical protein